MPEIINNKEMAPFEHYAALYAKLNPAEAAGRCGAAWDPVQQSFTMRLLYVDYRLTWPVFSISASQPDALALHSLPAQVLLMRFLLEGKCSRHFGDFLTYREMPWGAAYLKPYTGRCLKRAAFAFGTRLEAFRRALTDMPVLPLMRGDAACQVEFMPDYEVRLILWEGDDEFPPGAQILYSDNFPQSFSAEDRTVAAELLIEAISLRMARGDR